MLPGSLDAIDSALSGVEGRGPSPSTSARIGLEIGESLADKVEGSVFAISPWCSEDRSIRCKDNARLWSGDLLSLSGNTL